jgi:exodeoxyribonuclease VII large subunit
MNEKSPLSLSALCDSVSRCIKLHYSKDFWVKAEISGKIGTSASGMRLFRLIEDVKSNKAYEVTGKIFYLDFIKIQTKLAKFGLELKDGDGIVAYGRIEYSGQYGMQFIIRDISEDFLLGQIAKKRKEVEDRLKNEGIYTNNKKLILPILTKRVALIGSGGSKGLSDFVDHIKNHLHFFKIKFFKSQVQGTLATSQIVQQLHSIRSNITNYDVVVILRGGGSATDFSVFNDYELCKEICNFPIPIICGIGHKDDNSIIDNISYKSVKNPTDIAVYLINLYSIELKKVETLIDNFRNNVIFLFKSKNDILNSLNYTFILSTTQRLENYKQIIFDAVEQFKEIGRRLIDKRKEIVILKKDLKSNIILLLQSEKILLNNLKTRINDLYKPKFIKAKNDIRYKFIFLVRNTEQLIKNKNTFIKYAQEKVQDLDPINILKRGFTLSKQDDNIIINIENLDKEKPLEVNFFNGTVITNIKIIKKH